MKRTREEDALATSELWEDQPLSGGASVSEIVRSTSGFIRILTLDLGPDVELDEVINPKFDRDPNHVIPVGRDAWVGKGLLHHNVWHVGENMGRWMRSLRSCYRHEELWAVRGTIQTWTRDECDAGELGPLDAPVSWRDLVMRRDDIPEVLRMSDLSAVGLWPLKEDTVFSGREGDAFVAGRIKLILHVPRRSICSVDMAHYAMYLRMAWPPINVMPRPGDDSATRWPNDPMTQDTAAIMPAGPGHHGALLFWCFQSGTERAVVKVEYALSFLSKIKRPQNGVYRDATGNMYSYEMVTRAANILGVVGPYGNMIHASIDRIAERIRSDMQGPVRILVQHSPDISLAMTRPGSTSGPAPPPRRPTPAYSDSDSEPEEDLLPSAPSEPPPPPARRRGRPRGSGRGSAAPRGLGRRGRGGANRAVSGNTPASISYLFGVFFTNESLGRQAIATWPFPIHMEELIPPASVEMLDRARVERFVGHIIDNNFRLAPSSQTSPAEREATISRIVAHSQTRIENVA